MTMKNPFLSQKIQISILVVLSLCAFLIVACQGSRETTKPAIVTAIPMASKTELPKTKPAEEIETGTFTLVPTNTPLPTRFEETRIFTSSPAPSLTPLTTFAPEERNRVILDLLKNNRGCRLPCWWGFIPGETRWDEAQPFLRRLGKIYMPVDQTNQSLLNIDVRIPVPKEIDVSPLAQTYIVENYGDGIIQKLEIYPGNAEAYYLVNILRDYGMPGEVWILTFSAVPGRDVPFVVVLFYPNLGILIKYDTLSLRTDPIRGCPEQAHYPLLYLWSPKKYLTFDDIAKGNPDFFASGGEIRFKRLEDATNLNPSLFYKIFKDPKNSQCLETPLNLWQ